MNWRDEPTGPSAGELRRKALEYTHGTEANGPRERGEPGRLYPGDQPLLTPEDRQRIRAGRDTAAREREGVVWRDGKWRLPPNGGTHR